MTCLTARRLWKLCPREGHAAFANSWHVSKRASRTKRLPEQVRCWLTTGLSSFGNLCGHTILPPPSLRRRLPMSTLTLEQKIHRAVKHAIPFKGTDRPHGICFRNVKQKFANQHDILSAEGSLFTGGRYNFVGAFGVLYLACDPHTCLEEVAHVTRVGGFRAAENFPRTFIGIRVRLS